jgi:methionyl-tRNA formyltransferase
MESSIPVLQPTRMKDESFTAALRSMHADLGVVAAYGRLLTEEILAIPRLGMINVHASLLPRYRGAAPVHRAIVNGESETGVTIMRVVLALDAGPIMSTARRPIGPDETSEEVESDLATLGASLLVKTADALAAGAVTETPQDDAAATYAHRLAKDDGVIDWRLPAERLHNLVRGLHPWPHAQTTLNGKRLIVLRTHVGPELAPPATVVGAELAPPSGVGAQLAAPSSVGAQLAAPGSIVVASPDDLRIATGAGTLQLLEVQTEGKRPMAARDFLAGHQLSIGDRLGT